MNSQSADEHELTRHDEGLFVVVGCSRAEEAVTQLCLPKVSWLADEK